MNSPAALHVACWMSRATRESGGPVAAVRIARVTVVLLVGAMLAGGCATVPPKCKSYLEAAKRAEGTRDKERTRVAMELPVVDAYLGATTRTEHYYGMATGEAAKRFYLRAEVCLDCEDGRRAPAECRILGQLLDCNSSQCSPGRVAELQDALRRAQSSERATASPGRFGARIGWAQSNAVEPGSHLSGFGVAVSGGYALAAGKSKGTRPWDLALEIQPQVNVRYSEYPPLDGRSGRDVAGDAGLRFTGGTFLGAGYLRLGFGLARTWFLQEGLSETDAFHGRQQQDNFIATFGVGLNLWKFPNWENPDLALGIALDFVDDIGGGGSQLLGLFLERAL